MPPRRRAVDRRRFPKLVKCIARLLEIGFKKRSRENNTGDRRQFQVARFGCDSVKWQKGGIRTS
jgi:hypothetical protein